MKKNMIDLHCHSNQSDGTLAPEALAARGRAFALMALTDHDTCAGAAAFLAAGADAAGPRLAGIELSLEPGAGYGKFHLLGLGIDPAASDLMRLLLAIRAGRDERNGRMYAALQKLGLKFPLSDLEPFAAGAIVARPHFAQVLIRYGWATDMRDAFEKYLGAGRPAYVARYRPSPAEAIAAVHAAGGLAVMAHPRYWTTDAAALRRGLAALKDAGLDGIEAYYQKNAVEETALHLRVARDLGLLVTAGSDFHGENKPDVPLGMTVPDEAALVAALTARLAERKGFRKDRS